MVVSQSDQGSQEAESPMSTKAIYPGTFDPITRGHIDLAERASQLFDEVVVAIAASPTKQPLFSLEERLDMAALSLKDIGNISVIGFDGLLIDSVREQNAQVVLRGLRAVSDFEYEFQMAGINTRLSNEFETIFLMASENQQFVASRLVKEIHSLGGDVSSFVPAVVLKHLENKK